MALKRAAAILFGIALLYPLAGLVVPVGAWRWDDAAGIADSVRVSLVLTAIAMVIVVAAGTPARICSAA